jgi:hypothetical protein
MHGATAPPWPWLPQKMPPFFCPQLISSKFAFLGLVMQPSERRPPIFVIGFRADLVLETHTHRTSVHSTASRTEIRQITH